MLSEMNLRCLIIGMGSAGLRHAEVLTRMGYSVSVVSGRSDLQYDCFCSLPEAIESGAFDYVVISNPTSEHYPVLSELLRSGCGAKLLVEKPIFDKSYDGLKFDHAKVFVGYNLRFHPALQELRMRLEGKALYSVQAYVGQYLPDWRKDGRDYTESYSASRRMGGGVLRDLSHELDYITWIAGACNSVTAVGGKVSSLCIDSDDACGLLMETDLCPVVLCQMNYLDRHHRREVIINYENGTIHLDLITGCLDDGSSKDMFVPDAGTMTSAMHADVLTENDGFACTAEEGLAVLNLLEYAEDAMAGKMWVKL